MDKLKGMMISAFAGVLGFIGLASAQYFGSFNTQSLTESVINFYKDFFGPIFAALFGQYSTEEFLFAKILVFLLLIILIYFILQKSKIFGEKKGLAFLVSLIVSILALRFLPDNELINGILLPYGVLGVALTTFLPFLIYFFFVHQSVPGGFMRRGAWALYALVFVVLLGFRWNDISPASEWLYISGIILVILALIFDKTIHGYFYIYKQGKFIGAAHERTIALLQSEYLNIVNVNTPEAENRRRSIQQQLRNLGANLP